MAEINLSGEQVCQALWDYMEKRGLFKFEHARQYNLVWSAATDGKKVTNIIVKLDDAGPLEKPSERYPNDQ